MGNGGSSRALGLPAFPEGFLWSATALKWVAGGTRPYRREGEFLILHFPDKSPAVSEQDPVRTRTSLWILPP